MSSGSRTGVFSQFAIERFHSAIELDDTTPVASTP